MNAAEKRAVEHILAGHRACEKGALTEADFRQYVEHEIHGLKKEVRV